MLFLISFLVMRLVLLSLICGWLLGLLLILVIRIGCCGVVFVMGLLVNG